MSDPATGQPGRNVSGPSTRTRRAAGVLAGLMLAGLALRLIIAYLLPGSGFAVDLGAFQFWAANLAQQGPWGFYDRPFFHDYTPGYLYVLWAMGYLGGIVGGLADLVGFTGRPTIAADLVKLPAILADLVLAYLAWSMVRELGGSERRALLGAAFVLFVPITWFDSVVWGQVDSVGVVFLLLSLRAVWRDQPERAAVWGTVAAVIKPQLGILIPIVAAVVIRRALLGRPPDEHGLDPEPVALNGGSAAEAAAGGAGLRDRLGAWSRRERGPIRILTTAAAGVATAALLAAPFGLSLGGLLAQVVKTAGGYPYLTVNAYNPWALVMDDNGSSLAATGSWLCDAPTPDPARCPDPVVIGPLWAVIVGTLLILTVITLIVVAVARHPDRRTILVALAVMAIAFFVVPTRVHERYLFPFVIVGAILAALSVRWRIAWIVLVVANFLNLYVVLTTLYPDNPSIDDWLGIGGAIRSPAGIAIIALTHLVAFGWAIWQLRAPGRAALAVEVAEAGADPSATTAHLIAGEPVAAGPEGAGVPGGAMSEGAAPSAIAIHGARVAAAARIAAAGPAPGQPESAAVATVAARSAMPTASPSRAAAASPAVPDAGVAARPAGDEGRLAALRRRIGARPLGPDRSRALTGERGGGFGRLDLWLLVVIVVVTLSFRLYRLEEPRTMHFDEVYHARTATEFLQSWRYGEDHDIYEYTHPHLAKYAMAAGIVLFGEDTVSGESDLGVPVRDAAIERRWDDPTMPGGRAGDRLYLATGSDVRVYDLASRAPVATIVAPGAVAVSVAQADHRLLIGTDTGAVLALDTQTTLDPLRAAGTSDAMVKADALATLDQPAARILAAEDGTSVVVATTDDQIVSIDGIGGLELGRLSIAGIADMAEAGTGDALVARPPEVVDLGAVAATLAELIGGSETEYEALLSTDAPLVVIPGALGATTVGDIQTAIAEGRLTGLAVEKRARVAVAARNGVTFVATSDASIVDTIDLDEPASAIARVTGVDEDKLYVGNGARITVVLIGGTAANDPRIDRSFWMPSELSRIAYDSATQLVHALGQRQDGSGPTDYVVEPHANAVFADTPLPFEPSAWAIDEAPRYPSADRQQLLTFAADGASATADIGRWALAWRLPGVLSGVLAAAVLFLLARLLWRRRVVAVLLAAFVILDPMLFVQSRIAMNDVYAGLFIVAAVTLFGALWTGVWRWRGAFWVVMPLVGVLLGLAFATKWVGLYAIGAIGVLFLMRSALGRVLLIAGLLTVTTVLGYMAVSVPSGATAGGNLTFLVIMIGLTLAAVVAAVLHPVAWSDDEVRFAVGAPAVLGIAVFLGSIALGPGAPTLAAGPLVLPAQGLAFGLLVLAGLAYLAFLAAGRFGFGPLAPPPAPEDPVRLLPPAAEPPPDWLRPGALLGLPVVWLAICLVAIPLGVYVVSYIPWALLDNHQLVPGWPAGHTGQTLWDLTISMYDYHDKLRATHAASSPWWAWPFDLKPVWFYQGSFAGDTSGAIYDHGSLVTWWLAIAAMGFVAWQAFRRRSLQLALVAIVFACLWLPWARIDRATFQYHWYTSLPFTMLALAYLVAELWNGPSRRTWLLARAAAALAIMGAPLLWVFKAPLCVLAGVEQVNPGSAACVGNPGQLILTTRVAGIAAVMVVASILLIWQLLHLDSPDARGRVDPRRRLAWLAVTGLGAWVALAIVGAALRDDVILTVPGLQAELIWLVIAIPLAAAAWVVLTARDPRRFAIGVVLGATAWTVAIYPNISALPLPSVVVNAYQGILPTWLYPFQFAVNTDPAGAMPALLAPMPAILFGALTLTAVIVAYSAWVWRLALAERDAGGADSDDGLARGSA